jgi:hypothetical protein
MSTASDVIKTADSSIGKAAQTFVEKLPENIATVTGGVSGFYIGQAAAWGVGATAIGATLYPIVLPTLAGAGVICGAVYSCKFARRALGKDKKEKTHNSSK